MALKIGFYGAGLISHMHSAFLAACSVEHAVVAVHDPDPSRAQAFAQAHNARVATEEQLLDLVDVVYITTWTAEHPRLVRAAAERGHAVFCEKPLATTAAVATEMADVAEASGIVTQVGLLLRFLPQFILAHHLVRDSRAGKLLAVSFRDDQYIPNQGRYASTWRTDPARCGRGALLEHSIHDVDILRWLGGDIAAVSAGMREIHGYPKIDDVAVVRLEYANGAIAALTSIWHDILERPSMRHIEIFSERLHIVIDDKVSGHLRWQFTGEPEVTLSGDGLVAACTTERPPPSTETVPFLGTTIFNPATPFLTAARDGSPAPIPFREALGAHRIVDAIYASADGGGGVEIVRPHP